jgi:hypothetical protein
MDEKLKQHYESMFAMFATDAWSDWMVDVNKMFDANNHVLPIQNEQELHFKRGQLDVLQWLRSLKSSYEASYAELTSGDASNE